MADVKWKVAGASVTGFSHQIDSIPCQDAHAVMITPTGWLIAVVSDGAGSAARSAEGSRMLVDSVVTDLLERIGDVEQSTCIDQNLIREWIVDAVETVRGRLLALTDGNASSLRDFHATLLGVLAGPNEGIFFHVGDGAGCATSSKDISNIVLSMPANGEYANETFFVTQEDWQNHLRFTPFDSQYNLIALMSDGVTPFALARGGATLFPPFFSPLSDFLTQQDRLEAEQAIVEILERDAIRPITGDDKTLVWALRINSDE